MNFNRSKLLKNIAVIFATLTIRSAALAQFIGSETPLIPNKIYTGSHSGKSTGSQRFCRKLSEYALSYSAVFKSVDVDIPMDEGTQARSFNVNFLLGPVHFTGKSSGVNPWTCENFSYTAKLGTDSAMLSLTVVPDPFHKENARFELTRLSLGKLDLEALQVRHLGISLNFAQISPYWDSRVERHFNQFSQWILESSIKSLINDQITKQVAGLVQHFFGSQKSKAPLSLDDSSVEDQLLKLDKVLAVD